MHSQNHIKFQKLIWNIKESVVDIFWRTNRFSCRSHKI